MLRLTYVWPLTKTDENTKNKRAELDACPYKWHDQRPDWDNAPKSLVDVMGLLNFFKDDKQIVDAQVFKLRGRKPMILVELREIGPDVSFGQVHFSLGGSS